MAVTPRKSPYIEPARAQRYYAVRQVKEHFPHLDAQTIAYRLAYATFVSLEHRILYMETPKAACTTMKHFLRELCGAPQIEYPLGELRETRRDMFVHVRSNVPLPSLLDLDDDAQRQVLSSPEYLRFCVVRNPYTRIVSAWRNKVLYCEPGYEDVYHSMLGAIPPLHGKRMLPFDEFLRFLEGEPDLCTCNPHWRRQVDLLYVPAIAYTHVGRLENLSETMRMLRAHVNRAALPAIGASNSSRGGGGVLTESAAARIFALYSADFDTFAYERESWHEGAKAAGAGTFMPDQNVFDEIVERNLVISLLYEQYASLEARHSRAYRFSLARLQDMLRWRRR